MIDAPRILSRLILSATIVFVPGLLKARTIQGEIKFASPSPSPNRIKVTKDQDYCGATIPDETYLVGPDGGLKNAVVFLEETPANSPSPNKERVLENSGCRFAPRILAMRRGDKLIVKNSDPKLHIVHSYLDKRTVFNLALPFRGQTMDLTRRVDKIGILQVNCDTHAWMRGYIHVFDHPYFAVSDKNGRFTILEVPPGQYTLKVWHEGAGVRTKEVRVGKDSDVKFEFAFENQR